MSYGVAARWFEKVMTYDIEKAVKSYKAALVDGGLSEEDAEKRAKMYEEGLRVVRARGSSLDAERR